MNNFKSLCFLAIIAIGCSPKVPVGINLTDGNAHRQGKWITYFDKNEWLTNSKDSMSYYRVTVYKDGLPSDTVREFYPSRKIKRKFKLLSDNPEDVLDGKIYSYREDGTIEMIATYVSGKEVDERRYEPDGSFSEWHYLTWKGRHYLAEGIQDSSLFYFQKALKFEEKQFGKHHIRYAYALNNLAVWNRDNHKLLKAESYLFEAMKTTETIVGKTDQAYIILLNNSANLLTKLGSYKQAAEQLAEALALKQHVDGPTNPVALGMLNNLGITYEEMGDYKKAMSLFQKAIELKSDYSDVIINLGNIYFELGYYSKAETMYEKVMKLFVAKADSIGQTNLWINLAVVARTIGDFDKAERYLNNAWQLSLITHDVDSEISSLELLTQLYLLKGEHSKADTFVAQTIKAQAKRPPSGDPDFSFAFELIAQTYCEKGMYDRAEPFYLDHNKKVLKAIEYYFPSLSEAEKESFYSLQKPALEEFYAFCLLQMDQNPGVLSELYNMQLATKALLLNNGALWKQRIRRSGDKKLFTLYTEWEQQQAALARLYSANASNHRATIDSLERRNNLLEKELSKRSEMLTTAHDKKRTSWQEIRDALKDEEVAVEVVRVRNFGQSDARVDSSNSRFPAYRKYELTKRVSYIAFVITANSQTPSAVVLKNGNDLESHWIKGYHNRIQAGVPDGDSYNEFWKPIAERIDMLSKKDNKKKTRVHFSPDGIYNLINLNTLYNPDSRKYLIEEIDLSILTSTKDLLQAPIEETSNTLTYLVGYPDYELAHDQTTPPNDHDEKRSIFPLEFSQGTFADLPGTKAEVEAINSLLTESGWEAQMLTGDQALEETLKDSYRPRVLHIATHGYFLPDTTVSTDPLMRSGLLLAGAAQSMRGDFNDNAEDGILTAYEAMNLNLDNTDLVVLSACETGLGEIRNGEGVYGLQRAFWIAGARNIIMSLWRVNDDVTRQLMTQFYAHWLKTGNKIQAFRAAQEAIRKEHPQPYYWGAFVIIGH